MNSHFLESANACTANGRRLLEDADMLEFAEPPSTSFALAIIAQEEFAKGFLLCLVARDVIPWHPLVYRATRDHTCKQLLGIIMDHLNPDTDVFLKRMEEWQSRHQEHCKLLDALKEAEDTEEQGELWLKINTLNAYQDGFPTMIADAMNILRHEKIGRWQSWFAWADDPQYDQTAKQIGDGRLDKEKQNSLYVRLNKNGVVVGTPSRMTPEISTEARQRAGRLGRLVESLIQGDVGGFIDFDEVESAMKDLFANLVPGSES